MGRLTALRWRNVNYEQENRILQKVCNDFAVSVRNVCGLCADYTDYWKCILFTGYTTEGIIHDTVENTIIALAIAIPLSGGRWDFGPGAIIMLGAIIGGNLGMQLHMGTFGVLLCCVGACMMLALIEAVFYVTLRVPNMIISMGIVMVYEAVSGLLNNGLGVNFLPMIPNTRRNCCE